MSSILVGGIGELVTNDSSLGDGSPLGILTDAAVVVSERQVRWVGREAEAPAADAPRPD